MIKKIRKMDKHNEEDYKEPHTHSGLGHDHQLDTSNKPEASNINKLLIKDRDIIRFMKKYGQTSELKSTSSMGIF